MRQMKKSTSLILLALTLAPLILSQIESFFFRRQLHNALEMNDRLMVEALFMQDHRMFIIALLWLLVMVLVYLFLLFSRDYGPKDKDWRFIWMTFLLLGNWFAMLIFWYQHIWKATFNIALQEE
ncbi:MAG: hypothetical protein H6662_20415 [Ardenticatenaceae bacterium]|nr:hypothetical protein [Anaerolineales bacterium]MCB8923951.1 hypothetical protein [Ardenticatenaceae bacterium]MCB9005455.1 hypothetical protein [Ardenticatenaceae bacterium]